MRVIIGSELAIADIGDAGSFRLRLLGWFNPAFRHKRGVLICPCNAVHTLGMRRPIDVVFVDKAMFVRRIVHSLRPWRLAACCNASCVLELRAGAALQYGLREGMTMEFIYD